MKHTFKHEGKYVDTEIECFTQDKELHILQRNIEHDTDRKYDVGRVTLNVDEFFEIYHELVKTRDHKFDTASQYVWMLMNMYGSISLQSARELFRIATFQADNFLVIRSDKHQFDVLAIEDPGEQLRLEENFGDRVIATCRYRKVKVKGTIK
jgi:hypothetical protein